MSISRRSLRLNMRKTAVIFPQIPVPIAISFNLFQLLSVAEACSLRKLVPKMSDRFAYFFCQSFLLHCSNPLFPCGPGSYNVRLSMRFSLTLCRPSEVFPGTGFIEKNALPQNLPKPAAALSFPFPGRRSEALQSYFQSF